MSTIEAIESKSIYQHDQIIRLTLTMTHNGTATTPYNTSIAVTRSIVLARCTFRTTTIVHCGVQLSSGGD